MLSILDFWRLADLENSLSLRKALSVIWIYPDSFGRRFGVGSGIYQLWRLADLENSRADSLPIRLIREGWAMDFVSLFLRTK